MEGGAALGVEGGGAGEAGPGEGEVLGTHPGPEAGPAGSSGRLPLLFLMLLGDRHPRLLPSKLECHSLACLEPWAEGRELRAGPGGPGRCGQGKPRSRLSLAMESPGLHSVSTMGSAVSPDPH